MYKFTSPLTHQKLQQNRSSRFQSPEFDYSSLTAIDTKFDDFCKQSRRELFTEKSPPQAKKFNPKAVSEDREKGPTEVETLDGKEPKLGFMKEKILETYKNQRKSINNLGIVNPVVGMFGNAFIATFFQSLIIKSVEDIFELELDDPLSFSNQYRPIFFLTPFQSFRELRHKPRTDEEAEDLRGEARVHPGEHVEHD